MQLLPGCLSPAEGPCAQASFLAGNDMDSDEEGDTEMLSLEAASFVPCNWWTCAVCSGAHDPRSQLPG